MCMYIHIYTYIYGLHDMYMHSCIYTHIYIYIHYCIYIYIYAYTCTYIYTYIYTYTYICTYVYTLHIHTYVHVHIGLRCGIGDLITAKATASRDIYTYTFMHIHDLPFNMTSFLRATHQNCLIYVAKWTTLQSSHNITSLRLLRCLISYFEKCLISTIESVSSTIKPIWRD